MIPIPTEEEMPVIREIARCFMASTKQNGFTPLQCAQACDLICKAMEKAIEDIGVG